jgi:hypothetical protein
VRYIIEFNDRGDWYRSQLIPIVFQSSRAAQAVVDGLARESDYQGVPRGHRAVLWSALWGRRNHG